MKTRQGEKGTQTDCRVLAVDDRNQVRPGLAKNRPDWHALRREYETGTIGYRVMARRNGISISTFWQRMQREKWKRNDKLVKSATKEIEAAVEARVKKRVQDELEPWIEAQKTRFIRRSYKVAEKGIGRAERFMRLNKNVEAKSEAMIAKASSDWVRIGRVSLGLTDGSAPVTPVSLNILTNRSAVQIISPNESA